MNPPDTLLEAGKERLETLFRATLAHLDPARRVRETLAELAWPGPGVAEVVILAAGKAACTMARGALEHVSNEARDVRGVVIAPGAPAGDLAPLVVLPASHPVPDQRSVAAAQAALEVMAGASSAHVLALISGGASALMALPAPGISLADKIATIDALMHAGADIHALNTVRKHLSAVKGGRLAEVCPEAITTLVASDVVGDELACVGSGPTLPDPTTYRAAFDVVATTVGWPAVPAAVREVLERGAAGRLPDTPATLRPGDRAVLCAGCDALLEAACHSGRELGMATKVFARGMVGDVGDVARRVAAQVHRVAAAHSVASWRGRSRQPGSAADRPGRPFRASTPPDPGPRVRCYVAGGEPTIALPAQCGSGGRAQQVALLVARDIAGVDGVAVLCAGSDGIDGSSPAAGGVVDGTTWAAIAAAGIDPAAALRQCDSHTALAAVGGDLITGPTGVNHADLILILVC